RRRRRPPAPRAGMPPHMRTYRTIARPTCFVFLATPMPRHALGGATDVGPWGTTTSVASDRSTRGGARRRYVIERWNLASPAGNPVTIPRRGERLRTVGR